MRSQFLSFYVSVSAGLSFTVRLGASISLLSALASPAVAQEGANSTPEVLRTVQQYKTKEQVMQLLNDRYHFAASETWPNNFPVPVYTSNLVSKSFTHSTKGKPSAGATLITKDQPRTVFDFYNSACRRANWKVKAPSAKALTELSTTGEMYMLAAENGKQSMYITCRKHKESGGTFVSISWSKI